MDIIFNYLFTITELFNGDAYKVLLVIHFVFMYKYWKFFVEQKILLCITIFILYGFISTLFCLDKNVAFYEILNYVFGWSLPFFLGYTLRKNYNANKIVLTTLFIFSSLVLIGLFSYYGFFPEKFCTIRFSHDKTLTIGTWYRVLFAGKASMMFAISLTMLLFLKNINTNIKIALTLSSILFLIGIFLSGSRIYSANVVGLLFFIIIFYYYKKRNFKRSIIILATSLIIVLLCCTNNFVINRIKQLSITKDVSIVYRINMYKYAISTFKKYPIFGTGPAQATLKDEFLSVDTDVGRGGHLHSIYLSILANFGMLGLILFLLIIFYILKELVFTYKTTGDILSLSMIFAWICILLGDNFDTLLGGSYFASLYFLFTGLALRMKTFS